MKTIEKKRIASVNIARRKRSSVVAIRPGNECVNNSNAESVFVSIAGTRNSVSLMKAAKEFVSGSAVALTPATVNFMPKFVVKQGVHCVSSCPINIFVHIPIPYLRNG